MTEFKDRLRQFRAERELSAAQIAVVFNKSEGAIRMWETGRAKPDADTLIKLAEFFNCSTDYLLGLTEYRNNAESYEHQEVVTKAVGRFEEILGQLDNHIQEELANTFTNTISTLASLPNQSDNAMHELLRVVEYIGETYARAEQQTKEWSEQNLLMLVSECFTYKNNLGNAITLILEEYLAVHIEHLKDEESKRHFAELTLRFFPDNLTLKSLLS